MSHIEKKLEYVEEEKHRLECRLKNTELELKETEASLEQSKSKRKVSCRCFLRSVKNGLYLLVLVYCRCAWYCFVDTNTNAGYLHCTNMKASTWRFQMTKIKWQSFEFSQMGLIINPICENSCKTRSSLGIVKLESVSDEFRFDESNEKVVRLWSPFPCILAFYPFPKLVVSFFFSSLTIQCRP